MRFAAVIRSAASAGAITLAGSTRTSATKTPRTALASFGCPRASAPCAARNSRSRLRATSGRSPSDATWVRSNVSCSRRRGLHDEARGRLSMLVAVVTSVVSPIVGQTAPTDARCGRSRLTTVRPVSTDTYSRSPARFTAITSGRSGRPCPQPSRRVGDHFEAAIQRRSPVEASRAKTASFESMTREERPVVRRQRQGDRAGDTLAWGARPRLGVLQDAALLPEQPCLDVATNVSTAARGGADVHVPPVGRDGDAAAPRSASPVVQSRS